MRLIQTILLIALLTLITLSQTSGQTPPGSIIIDYQFEMNFPDIGSPELSAKIGNNLIIYRLQFQNAQSSFRMVETRKKNPKLDDGFKLEPSSVLTYKDHKHKKLYLQDEKKPELIGIDTLIYGSWTMVPEATKDILGYACQKAISEKDKDIAVWFSFDLPIPDGPLEFQGLPGAILAVESKKINFIAINIANTPASESVEMPKAEKYLSRKEFIQKTAKN